MGQADAGFEMNAAFIGTPMKLACVHVRQNSLIDRRATAGIENTAQATHRELPSVRQAERAVDTFADTRRHTGSEARQAFLGSS